MQSQHTKTNNFSPGGGAVGSDLGQTAARPLAEPTRNLTRAGGYTMAFERWVEKTQMKRMAKYVQVLNTERKHQTFISPVWGIHKRLWDS